MPDGRHVLINVGATTPEARGLYVAALDTGESQRLAAADSSAVYDARSHNLLFVRQGTLVAQSFNPERPVSKTLGRLRQ